jgi:hypothetical protein
MQSARNVFLNIRTPELRALNLGPDHPSKTQYRSGSEIAIVTEFACAVDYRVYPFVE